MASHINHTNGFARLIFIIIVIILVLSFLSIDIRSFVESTQTQGNFAFVWELLKQGWDTVAIPIVYVKDIYCSSSLGASVCEALENAIP